MKTCGLTLRSAQKNPDARKRLQKVSLLFQISGKVCQLADLVFKPDYLLAFLPLERRYDVGQFRLEWVFHLDGNVKALVVHLVIAVDPRISDAQGHSPDGIGDDDWFWMREVARHKFWNLVEWQCLLSRREELRQSVQI